MLFYAVLEPLRLECPHCGRLVCFGKGAPDRDSWNPLASILTCPGCHRRWLLAMRLFEAPRRDRGFLPPDQVPSNAQYVELRRQYAQGVTAGKIRPKQPANRWEEEGCTCWPDPWRIGCPVHDGSVNPSPILPSAAELIAEVEGSDPTGSVTAESDRPDELSGEGESEE